MLSHEEAEAFRQRCHSFLSVHATQERHELARIGGGVTSDRGEVSLAIAREFTAALVEAGLAGLPYPKEYGGAGLTVEHDRIWREVYTQYPILTESLLISQGIGLPMLNDFGTHEQKAELMAKNISAEHLWCQLFSEPGAGSDVASLQMRAERDGDEWVLNGQKVWTTFAHLADYGTVLARTNSEAPKHAGISMFIVDMRDPSVEIRPIHQIDGTSHFNEVFFNDTRVPNSRLLGVLNEGWSQTTAMLMYERVAIGSGETMGVSHPVAERLIETARLNGRIDQPVLRQNLMRLWTEETVKSLVSMRTQAEIKSGKPPGPGGSIGKLQGSRIHRLTRTVVSEVVGASVTAWEPESDLDQWSRGIVHSLGMSIGGGTDEIQRNVIGERVLGLPREPVVDRNVPFKDLMVGFAR